MNSYKYILEPYKGMKSRYKCPACQSREKTFSRYIDTETGEYLNPDVGRCNRENNCGYHYTPSQYFKDNPDKCVQCVPKYAPPKHPKTHDSTTFDKFINSKCVPKGESTQGTQNTYSTHGTQSTHGTHGMQSKRAFFIDKSIFKKSLSDYDKNTFIGYLNGLFGEETTNKIIDTYKIGTSKKWEGSTVFWQIDIEGNVRAGKIMQYDTNGHRIKKPFNRITWVHKVLNIDNYSLKQCLFGEHLIKGNDLPIAVVESEKTACIASIYLPQFIWLACGQLNGLNPEKCESLRGRTVFLFPDLKGFDKWQKKANELQSQLQGTRFLVSDYLERNANPDDLNEGYDLADYLINFDVKDVRKSDKKPDYPASWDEPLTYDPTDKWAALNHAHNKGIKPSKKFVSDANRVIDLFAEKGIKFEIEYQKETL